MPALRSVPGRAADETARITAILREREAAIRGGMLAVSINRLIDALFESGELQAV